MRKIRAQDNMESPVMNDDEHVEVEEEDEDEQAIHISDTDHESPTNKRKKTKRNGGSRCPSKKRHLSNNDEQPKERKKKNAGRCVGQCKANDPNSHDYIGCKECKVAFIPCLFKNCPCNETGVMIAVEDDEKLFCHQIPGHKRSIKVWLTRKKQAMERVNASIRFHINGHGFKKWKQNEIRAVSPSVQSTTSSSKQSIFRLPALNKPTRSPKFISPIAKSSSQYTLNRNVKLSPIYSSAKMQQPKSSKSSKQTIIGKTPSPLTLCRKHTLSLKPSDNCGKSILANATQVGIMIPGELQSIPPIEYYSTDDVGVVQGEYCSSVQYKIDDDNCSVFEEVDINDIDPSGIDFHFSEYQFVNMA